VIWRAGELAQQANEQRTPSQFFLKNEPSPSSSTFPRLVESTLISVMKRNNKEHLQTFTNPPFFSDLQSAIKAQSVTSIAGHVALSSKLPFNRKTLK